MFIMYSVSLIVWVLFSDLRIKCIIAYLQKSAIWKYSVTGFFFHPPGQKHWLGFWEAAPWGCEHGVAAEVGVVVWIMWALWVELPVVVVYCTFAVHSPEEPQYEHDHPQHHTAEGESLQAALVRGQEGCRPPGHNEEGSDKDSSMVQGRHCPPGP